ncbi:FtsX-like permease family protein [Micromonospora sp. NPDC007271]|uniref:FtsX-like permease family protein n=1 Tax=Micromonospora sp. NPDC007271 TaxID=3154587 RepID=UPI003400E33E
MRPEGMLRLAFAGTRADRARVTITTLGAAVAVLVLLCWATVVSIQPGGRYSSRMFTSETVLTNLATAMMLFTVPAMFFLAQCARLGAPGRNRRLAAFRLAGASPTQVVWVAAVETGLAASIGALAGTAAYLAGRALLDQPDIDGARPLPTDVLPALPMIVAIALGVPLLATALAVLLLRRVAITPFGLLRQSRRQRVRAWPGLLGLAGLAGFAALDALSRSDFVKQGGFGDNKELLWMVAILACAVLLMLGLMLGTAWIGHVSARLLLRLTRRPSALIAARQTLADPYDGSRTYTVILVTTAFGAGAMMLHSWLVTNVAVRAAANPSWDPSGTAAFRADIYDIVNMVLLGLLVLAALALLVALVESGVARRRTLAALVAAGTPRAVLARSMCWRVLIPAVPGIALACLYGLMAVRSFTATASAGSSHDFQEVCTGTAAQCADPALRTLHTSYQGVTLTFAVPLPWGDVAALAAAALLVILLVVAASILLQRSSTDPSELRAD